MIHKSSIMALIGAAICLVAPLLPWATIDFERMEIPDHYVYPDHYEELILDLPTLNVPASGFETIIYPTFFGFFLVVLGVALFTTDENRHIARGLFISGGGAVLLFSYAYAASAAILARDAVHAIYEAFSMMIDLPDYWMYWPEVSISFGCYMALIGALMALASGLLAFRERPLKKPSAISAGFCPSCGNAVAPGSKFCRKCGAKLQEEDTGIYQ